MRLARNMTPWRKTPRDLNRTAYTAVGVARTDDALLAISVPDRAYCGAHRVPWQCRTGFLRVVIGRNGLFNFVEFFFPGYFKKAL